LALNIPKEAGSVQLEAHMHRFYPGKTAGEGFFIAALQKPEGEWVAARPGKKKKDATTPELEPLSPSDWVLTQAGSSLYAVRNGAWAQQFFLSRLPGLLHPGVEVGDVFKGKWKPHPSMALLADSPLANWVDLDDKQVMTYLRREFVSGSFGQKGPVGVRWNGIGMGTANALGHGLNNLWPQGWRLRNVDWKAASLLALS
jgi:NOL1/NOP2/fmu family ribosome biogenesis protein